MLGDGGSPITYAAPCGFTSKALQLSKNLTDVNIPDCDDPDAAAWVGRDVESLTASINGDGVLAEEALPTWQAAFTDTDSVSAKIEIEMTDATYTYTGLFHLSALSYSADSGGRVNISVEMQSDGAVAYALVTAT
jgi:predicted secreted protein